MIITRDTLDRTIKLDLDTGRAESIEAAEQLAGKRVLQIVIGDGVASSATAQAALLTVVNAGARAFRGGVNITGSLNWEVTTRWAAGQPVAEALSGLGGTVIAPDELNSQHPTVIVGHMSEVPVGSVRLCGWRCCVAGGVVVRCCARQRRGLKMSSNWTRPRC